MFTIQYEVAEIFVITEFVLVALIMLVTCIMRVYLNYRDRRNAELRKSIEESLLNLLVTKQPLKVSEYKRKWRKISLLMPILFKFDKEHASVDWELMRTELLDKIILPLARRASRRHLWSLRYFAAEAFSQRFEKSDEKTIIRLVKDRVPLVSMHAVPAALAIGSEAAVNAIITLMSKQSLPTQKTYLRSFSHSPANTHTIVERRLLSTSEPSIRAVCYNILAKFPAGNQNLDVSQDLKSDNLNLRISALNYAAYTRSGDTVAILLSALKDPSWQVRLIALHYLKAFHPSEALHAVADLLHDSEWWVKMGAASALKAFGDKGKQLVHARTPELVDAPTEAINVSNIWW